MSPNVPDLKNLDLAFSHRLESSYQWATLAPFFDIKVTRYRTCISDRDLEFFEKPKCTFHPFILLNLQIRKLRNL